MVAISVYKGNLHRAPNTPRQWLTPTGKISLKDFRTLINRRTKALTHLQSTSNPSPNPNSHSDDSVTEQPLSNGSLELIVNDASALKIDELLNSNANENGKIGSTGEEDGWLVIPGDQLVLADAKPGLTEDESNAAVDEEHKTQAASEHRISSHKDESLDDKEKRKKEIEEKLQILNERKHKLVQVLKQILNAEEELRRRSNLQGRPAVALQVDVTNDSGSMSRHVTPRPGSEGADVAGADADDVSNHNLHSRNTTRTSSMSPSSDYLPRRAPFSMASRGVVASSPSRFGPGWNGQNGGNVSVTGTNYVGSPSPSPSPAGSGGTSVFRDATSPWN